MTDQPRVLVHGGAGSKPGLETATKGAAKVALEALDAGSEPIEAACQAVAHLEDDGRFNAGVGSNVRSDGTTVQMDAACGDSRGRFGAVACLERVRHPVSLARKVIDTEHLILAGRGAQGFARSQGMPEFDPSEHGHETETTPGDTVGCVLHDGDTFAAALSSGGTRDAMVGRVGDVPLPGCGLEAGPAGAVAATGNGEAIARQRTADRAYDLLDEGLAPGTVVEQVIEGFGDTLAGLIVVTDQGGAGGATRSMAFSQVEA